MNSYVLITLFSCLAAWSHLPGPWVPDGAITASRVIREVLGHSLNMPAYITLRLVRPCCTDYTIMFMLNIISEIAFLSDFFMLY